MQVIEPFDYHFVCAPGPAWEEGGFGPQNQGTTGLTQVPDEPILEEWLRGCLTDYHGGPCINGIYYGGWWVTRSHWVKWQADAACEDESGFFYRANDDGCYDLARVSNCTVGVEQWVNDIRSFQALSEKLIDRARTSEFPWCQELDTYTLEMACGYLKQQLDMAVDAKIVKIQTAKIDTDYPLRFDGPFYKFAWPEHARASAFAKRKTSGNTSKKKVKGVVKNKELRAWL